MREAVQAIAAAMFSLILALSTPLSGLGAQLAWADATDQASIDVVEEDGASQTPSDPAADQTGSLDPPAEETPEDTGGSSVTVVEDGDVETGTPSLPAQDMQIPQNADVTVAEEDAPATQGDEAAGTSPDQDATGTESLSGVTATVGAYDMDMGVQYAKVTLSGLTGPATITVKADAPCVLPRVATSPSEYDEQSGGYLAVVELPVEGDGTYELEGVQPMGVREVCATLADGTAAVLLDRSAVESQLAQIPATYSYANLGQIVLGKDGDFGQINVGQTSGGITWSYPWKTWNGYTTQCITPVASAGYQFARDTSLWASNDAVSFYEYVASRGIYAAPLGVPESDPGRQAVKALAAQISCDGDPLFAAEHFIMSCALRLQVDHNRTVFDTTDPDAAWNADWIRQAACDSLSGQNAAWAAPMWLQLSSSLSYNDSAVQVATALHVLWQQYSSRGYASLMNGITAQSWIGFANSSTAYNPGIQHVMGYSLSGRYVSDTSLTVSKESGYSNGTWSALKKAATWRLVSVSADGAEGATYDRTLSSADGSATVTFTGVPNSTQFRLYEVKAPSGYTARERIGLYTDGTGNWVMWNQEKGAWDNSVWKVTSAGKAVYTGVTGSAPSTVLHVMDAPTPPAMGKVELYKVSAKPEVTGGNASYSLKGAQYGVYSDQGCTKLATTITTGDDGHGVSGEVAAGTYWVKETKPSPGYALDTGSYKVTVAAGQTARVNGKAGTVKEEPQNDPGAISVKKVDSKTGKQLPQGNASLEGAQFTVKYYAGQYTKTNLPSKATRTWVIKTDKDGYSLLNDACKVSGDDFYRIGGRVTMPLGTITVQETKAPAGYRLNPEVFLRNIKGDGSGLDAVSVGMTFEVPETPLMGGLSVQKASSGELPQGANLAGIEFQVFNASAQAVSVGGRTYAPETAATVAAGTAKPVLTLTTDGKGYAATAADALPFGTYIVHESKVPESTCTAATAADQTVTVSQAGEVTPCAQAFVNDLARAGLSVQKLDAQTADGSAQGSATLAGASFEVRDAKGGVVLTLGATDGRGCAATAADALPLGTYTVTEVRAPSGYGMPEGGAASQTVTLSRPGEVVALQAPWRDPVLRGGLSVQKADVETGATTTQGAASFEGAEFEVRSANAQAVVVNGVSYYQDDVVATLVTDGSGAAATAADLLPVGAYKVRETKAPEGYLLNDDEWAVEVTAGAVTPVGSAGAQTQAQDAGGFDPLAALSSLFTATPAQAEEADGDAAADAQAAGTSVAEQVVRGGVRVHKVDADKGTGSAQGDATLEGTEFTIATMNRNPVVVDGVAYEYGSDVKKIYTDGEGVAQTGERDLPYGVYTVRETSAPIGYYDMGQMFEVVRDGVIVEVGQDFENDVKRGGVAVRKVDAETSDGAAQGSATLAGTVFEVVNASKAEVVVDGYYYDPGEVVTEIVTDGAGYASTGDSYLPYGTYTVREKTPPAGYLPGEDGFEQTVEVREGGVTVACAESFENQVKRGGLTLHKADAETADGGAQGAATLGGAEFNVYNANDQAVVVGGVEYAPGDVVATLVTDGAGDASTGARDLPVGSYTVSEVKAPEGYDPDPAAQTVTVAEDGATVACGSSFKDSVVRGGFGLRKADSETGASAAQGDATLAGARFEVANANEQDVVVGGRAYAKGEVVATIETDAGGWAQVPAGSLPYGTYTVTEVAAPEGYRVGQADADGGLTGEGMAFDVTVSSKGWWHSYEAGEASDQVVRGGLSLQKVDADGTDGAQGAATLAGARFEVANASAADVEVGGEAFAPGEAVLTLTTDESGRASTGARDLPYGTYSVREVASPDGYNPGDGTVQLVEVRSEGQVVACGDAFADEVMRGGFGLRKADSETGASAAQGDATLAGARFEVVTDSDRPVVVGGKAYAKGEVVATIETDAGGWAQVPARSLPYGDYTVTEVAAPSGYHVGEADGDGSLTGAGTSFSLTVSGQGWWRSYEAGEVSDQVARGGLSLHKADAETVDGAAQGAGTLAGAEFEVVNASKAAVTVNGASYAPGEVVLTLVTDEAGDASTGARDLPYGTYTVREKTPPQGYAADSGEQAVTVREEGRTVACGSAFKDRVLRGGTSVGKTDSELGAAQAQGAATLQGAVFEVASDNAQPVVVDGQTYLRGDVVARIVTDASGFGATAADALPYGTYRVREAKAPQGYLVNKTVWTVVIDKAGQVVAAGDASGEPNPGAQSDEGGAVVAGEPNAADADAPDATDGNAEGGEGGFDPLAALASVVGPSTADAAEAGAFHVGEDGTDGAGAAVGPEAPAADGAGASLEEDQEGEPAAAGAPGAVVPERVVRGDLELVKVREEGLSTLAGVPFLVTSATTGESHVLVTDASGRVDTAAAPHSSSTNASDAAYDAATGEVDDALLDASAGTWFSGARSGGAAPDDSRGALPYDTYTLEELPCQANAGLRMMSLTLTVAADSVKVDLGAVADRAAPSLATELTEPGGTHDAWAQGEATLTDAVAYDHFDPGSYTATMELYLDDGTALLGAGGQPVAASAELVVEGESGTFEVSAAFDCSGLAGRSVTAYETVRDASGAEVASHRELGDAGQTVAFHGMPSISTALSGKDGSKVVAARDGRVALVDAVSYEGLVPGRTYTLSGSLVDRATGEPLLDADGQAVTASAEIVPDSGSGTAEVAFDLDAGLVAGRSPVAFETLSEGGRELASHADPADEGQTAWVPSVSTSLADAASGTRMAVAAEGARLVDTVSYAGLKPGEAYTLTGTLMDAQTGEALPGPDDEPVTASVDFTPDFESGTAEVAFDLDASALAGRTLVCFESLSLGGREVASHADPADAAQTVRLPALETEFATTDGAHSVPGDGAHDLVDTVSWSNLEPGLPYRLVCTLADPATGEHLRSPETGGKYESSADFTAEGESGRAQVAFPGLTGLSDREAVALESLYTLGADGQTWVEVSRHRDVADSAQTVAFGLPVIRTELTAAGTGLHEAGVSSKAELVDSVAYEGMEPGAAYTLRGTLMDKSTGEALMSRGQKVEAAAEFTASESGSGTAEVSFSFDASDLGGRSVVAYEVAERDGQVVARHESMGDADQTVSLVSLRTTATDASDGDHEVAAASKVTLADRVEVKGLTPGATYTIETELADAQSKETVASSSAQVAPSKADTAFTVKAEVDTSKLAGRDLVFLETLKRDGKVVAQHRDYSDAGQTVKVGPSDSIPSQPSITPRTPSEMPQTGEGMLWVGQTTAGLVVLVLGIILCSLKNPSQPFLAQQRRAPYVQSKRNGGVPLPLKK